MMDHYLTAVSVTVHYNGDGFCMHVIVQSILVFIEAERFNFPIKWKPKKLMNVLANS